MTALLPYLFAGGLGALGSSLLGKHASGTKPFMQKFQTLSHEQKSVLKDLLKHPNINMSKFGVEKQPLYQEGGDYLSKILSQDPEMMKQFEAPMQREFNEQIVPGLAEQFSGMGARSSSGFNQAMGQQAGSLAERIAAMRAGLGMQASGMAGDYAQMPFQQAMQGQTLGLSRMGLGLGTPAFGQQAFGATSGAAQGIMGGVGQSLPFLLMHMLG